MYYGCVPERIREEDHPKYREGYLMIWGPKLHKKGIKKKKERKKLSQGRSWLVRLIESFQAPCLPIPITVLETKSEH